MPLQEDFAVAVLVAVAGGCLLEPLEGRWTPRFGCPRSLSGQLYLLRVSVCIRRARTFGRTLLQPGTTSHPQLQESRTAPLSPHRNSITFSLPPLRKKEKGAWEEGAAAGTISGNPALISRKPPLSKLGSAYLM